MNVFFTGGLALIIGHNKHWDGALVKITGPYSYFPNAKYHGYPCELIARSAEMMHKQLYPQLATVPGRPVLKVDIGPWSDSLLEKPKNFSARCTACLGNSFCDVTKITETETVFHCKAHGYCSLRHDQRTAEEAEWLTPNSKWAWLSLAALLTPQTTAQPTTQPIIEYPEPKPLPEPVCICDVFNFGCTCKRRDWEKSSG